MYINLPLSACVDHCCQARHMPLGMQMPKHYFHTLSLSLPFSPPFLSILELGCHITEANELEAVMFIYKQY